jgi:hypothetical protein
MRYVALLETNLHGSQNFEGKLPAPAGSFQDISVLAFPAPQSDSDTVTAHAPKVTATPIVADASNLFDGKPDTTCSLSGGQVLVELSQPFTARSVVFLPASTFNVTCKIQVSDDGQRFRPIRSLQIVRHNSAINVGPVPMAPVSVSFSAATGRFFRFEFSGAVRSAKSVFQGRRGWRAMLRSSS